MTQAQQATAKDEQTGLSQPVHGSSPAEVAPSPAAVEYAGFCKRLAAAAVDFAILLLIGFSLVMIVPILLAPVVGLPGDPYIVASFIAFWVIAPWLYCSLTECSSKQGTPGKTAMEIMVTDTEGRRISFGRATKRYWAKVISVLILLAGLIMIGLTARRQGLHDIMAQCLVVTRK